MPITRLLTVQQWTEQHPWPPLGGLRHLIFNATKENGFDIVVRRVGRRVLLDERAFFDWVQRQGDAGGHASRLCASATSGRGSSE